MKTEFNYLRPILFPKCPRAVHLVDEHNVGVGTVQAKETNVYLTTKPFEYVDKIWVVTVEGYEVTETHMMQAVKLVNQKLQVHYALLITDDVMNAWLFNR